MTPVKSADEMKIRISQLSPGFHEYHFSAHPASIGLDKNFTETVLVEVALDKTEKQLYLQASVKTAGMFQCDRCLEEFKQDLSARYVLFYVNNELDGAKHHPDEVQVISPDTVSIDLTEDVRQVVVVSVPLKLLCKDDCKGLCPRCGTNLNHCGCECREVTVDERWEQLKNITHN